MILSNYASYKCLIETLPLSLNNTQAYTMPNSRRLSDGTNITSFAARPYQNGGQGNNYHITWCNYFRLGSGNTPVTPSDWELDDDKTGSFSITLNITNNVDAERGTHNVVYTATCTNNSDSAITVREVGVIKRLYKYNYNNMSTSDDDAFLYIREVLDSPFTVNAGAQATFILKWSE